MKDEEEYYDNSWYREYLSVGEYVKWSGKPEKKTGFSIEILFSIVFVSIWCGVTAIITAGMLLDGSAGEDSFFNLIFMVPFWIAGVFLMFTLLIYPNMIRKHTKYAVTNRKVIVQYRKKVNFMNLDPLPPVQMSSVNKYGYGSIIIGTAYQPGSFPMFMNLPGQNQGSVVISNVKDPAKVYNIITNGR